LGEDISIGAILRAIGFDEAVDIAIDIKAHESLDLIFSILETR
jgi:hypothetical protein